MPLDDDDVRHVARLARLALSDQEISALRPQLAQILSYAEQVGEVAADDVPPTSHPYPLRNVWRDDDDVAEPMTVEQVLSGAPRAEDGRFHVPAILAEDE